MIRWIKSLDQVLRGEATRLSAIRDGTIQIPAAGLAFVIVLLGFIYGFCMGWYGLFNRPVPQYEQLLASTVKVSALFFLTLLVTFPSLYVFNALVGSRLSIGAVFKLLIAALGVTLAVLASFGPIVAFFSVSTSNYSFMVLLNVFIFSIAGVLGLTFLLQTLHRMSVAIYELPVAPQPGLTDNPAVFEPAAQTDSFSPDSTGPLDELDGRVLGTHVRAVFRCWVIVFALVGTQMAWVLRPFVGDPSMPFTWFRARESNFFEAVSHALTSLLK